MSSANTFNILICCLVKSYSFSNQILTLSLLMTAQETLVDSVDQDQTAQNVQSDL